MEIIKNRKLILENGSEYIGESFGDPSDKILEIVFNTSPVGYQEILSDPSYTDQGVVMSYPLIGNYGMAADDYETEIPTIGALIVREYNPEPSNFRSEKTLGDVMKEYGIAGLSGIDTRKLSREIRNTGSMLGILTDVSVSTEEGIDRMVKYTVPKDAVSRVSRKKEVESPAVPGTSVEKAAEDGTVSEKHFHVVAIDCGMKQNIVRAMNKKGLNVTIVPWNTPAERIEALNPDGVFLSNGPGDPTDVQPVIETVKKLIGNYPIFGICLGHQILSLAYGGMTYKLKFGHRGGNHPVKNLLTDKVEITSQNHSYAVDPNSLIGKRLHITHINLLDGTAEGACCEEDLSFSVQYHPESAPGPEDSGYLFDRFIDMMKKGEERKAAMKQAGGAENA